MDRAGHWFRGFVYCCLRQCGVVHELREAPRIWPFRGVPDYLGRGGFVLGIEIGGIAGGGIHPHLFALFADTHIESICCLAPAVWYHRPRLGVPPGGIT